MTPPLIGLMGRAQSGKDTAAAFLVEDGFIRYAFADPLKSAALHLDPIVGTLMLPGSWAASQRRLSEVVDALGWEEAKARPEVRRTLQRYGMSIREIMPDFWIRATLDPALAQEEPVVITDVRFENEAQAVVAAEGILVRIVRPGAPVIPGADHVSETALDDLEADYEVVNDGTLEQLRETILTIADEYAPPV